MTDKPKQDTPTDDVATSGAARAPDQGTSKHVTIPQQKKDEPKDAGRDR